MKFLIPVLAALAFSSCSPRIDVQTIVPPRPSGYAHIALKKDSKNSDIQHLKKLQWHLSNARNAYRNLNKENPENAITTYNYEVARVIDSLNEAGLRPWDKPVELLNSQTLTAQLVSNFSLQADTSFLAADSVRFTGEYAVIPPAKFGIGAPLVAYNKLKRNILHRSAPNISARTLTAVIDFSDTGAHLKLIDPFQHEFIQVNAKNYPMAADFAANVGYTLSTTRLDSLGLVRLIYPNRFNNTAAIERIQPYDPQRIPVLFVHGLQDTPASFAPMYFSLVSDPEIRKRYQFWAFTYPSGNPYSWSASLLRAELDRIKQKYPDHKKIVIIGHSMGGLLSRLMITDSKDKIWNSYFKTPPHSTKIYGSSANMLRQTLIFQSRSEISRAIFISTPHQGSEMAANWIGRTVSRFIHLPDFLADSMENVMDTLTLNSSGFTMSQMPNSIDSLSPHDNFTQMLNTLRPNPRIPFHSIIGDRGRGDTPYSSDGVVAYKSSHLGGAQSEKIVPSDHRAQRNPEGIEEVRRILYVHAGLKEPKAAAMRPSMPIPDAPLPLGLPGKR